MTQDEIANDASYSKAASDSRYINYDGDIVNGTIQMGGSGNNITFADNNKAVFGDDSDLQIYHDGSDSYITDTTGGNFFINDDGAGYLMMKGSDLYFRDTNNADMIHAQSTGYVKLYHAGSEKLATTSTGIDVTGTVTADGYVHTGDTDTKFHFPADNQLSLIGGGAEIARAYQIAGAYGVLRVNGSGSATYPNFTFNGDDNTGMYRASTDTLGFTTAGAEKMRIDATGQVGIGTSTPSAKLDVAGTTKAEQYLLDAVSKDISDTAVDVFIYDTRKDSDGGAWRKRTQHTSWYNETLNTATRGARKEFPAVAVIVAESNQFTIYDGDDPDMPMWMVFNAGSGAAAETVIRFGDVGGVVALNASLVVRLTNHYGTTVLNFISEKALTYRDNGVHEFKERKGLADRNTLISEPANYGAPYLINENANDIAMTVLPNAPIDSATGLPVPTIAVATDGGVSVIKDDGTVVDIIGSNAGYRKDLQVKFTTDNKIVYTESSNSSVYGWMYIVDVLSSDVTIPINAKGTALGWYDTRSQSYMQNSLGATIDGTINTPAGTDTSVGINIPNIVTGDNYIFAAPTGDSGLTIIKENRVATNTGSMAYITSDYNTGWMNGDIKLATLSDTDDTNVTGSELVANGLFSNGGDWSFGGGWNFANGQAEIDSNNNDLLSQDIGMVSGKTYTVTLYVTQYTDGYVSVRLGGTEIGTATATGFYAFTGVAAGSTLQIYGFTNPTLAVDDVSVRLAEEDRSVNGKGLQVFGTVTKTAVATGADLMAYSGFSASNYLQQPINTDIQNTNPRAFVCWVKSTQQASGYQYLWTLTNDSNYHYGLAIFEGTSGDGGKLYTYDQEHGLSVSSYMVADGSWHCVMFTDDEVDKKIYVDGNLVHTVNHGYDLNSANKQGMKLRIGTYNSGGNPMNIGSLSLLRVSGNIPSSEQIKKIYNDEKHLFQENAKATFYGSSDAVTALAYDDDTELLHAGTSAGRSVFQGLRRIDNTTDAVGAAISASNGMVAED